MVLQKKGGKVKMDNKTLEVIKVFSLVVIAISSISIAIWLAQIIDMLNAIGGNLEGINTSLFDLVNRE